MSVGVQNKRQMRCGITYSDDMRRLFVGTNMTKEVTSLDKDLGQIWTVEDPNCVHQGKETKAPLCE